MPLKDTRRRKVSPKRSNTPVVSTSPARRKESSSGSASVLRKVSSPREKPQLKNRELNTTRNAKSVSLFRRSRNSQGGATMPFADSEPCTAEHLRQIVAQLGLIPGDRANEFALAYDSIGPLLKMRHSLDVSAPVSPLLGADKFNLMYTPAKFSPAMRKMRTINKFAEDILLGYRRSTGVGCEMDVRTAVQAQIDILNKPSDFSLEVMKNMKKRKSRFSTIAKKRPSVVSRREPDARNNKKPPVDERAAPVYSRRKGAAVGEGPRRSRKSRSVCAQRAKPKSAEGAARDRRRPLWKRNKSAGARDVECEVLAADCVTEANNLPIFYKNLKLNY